MLFVLNRLFPLLRFWPFLIIHNSDGEKLQIFTGGCAHNVICDLRAIDPDLPLYAIGVVGEDEDGYFILL